MKKMLPFIAVVLFTAATSTGADPGEGIKPPDFLKAGNRYTFVFVDGPEYDRVHGEIKSFGPGTWMRVERMPEPESERRRIEVLAPQRPGASDKPAKEPRRLDIPAQTWLNLT